MFSPLQARKLIFVALTLYFRALRGEIFFVRFWCPLLHLLSWSWNCLVVREGGELKEPGECPSSKAPHYLDFVIYYQTSIITCFGVSSFSLIVDFYSIRKIFFHTINKKLNGGQEFFFPAKITYCSLSLHHLVRECYVKNHIWPPSSVYKLCYYPPNDDFSKNTPL